MTDSLTLWQLSAENLKKLKRLAIITSHPVQYNAPFFRLLASRNKVAVKVFYTWGEEGYIKKFDPGFGKNISWDLPLLDGYEYCFCENTATDPGSHHYKGIITPNLNKQVEEWNPDAILVYGWAFKSHLNALRHFYKKIPVFFRGDSTLIDEKPGVRKWIRRAFLGWVYQHVNKAFYTGVKNLEYFHAHGLKKEHLVYAPHSVENERFADISGEYMKKANEWRAQLKIHNDELTIFFAGKLEAKKNPFFLLKLMKELKGEKIKLLIVGSGNMEKELRQQATSDNRIIFLGFQNQQQMPVVYRLADIFILPSTGPGETWGLAANEAMACGLAVMMSDKCGAASDLVEEGKNGIIFSPLNSHKVIDYVKKLSFDPAMLAFHKNHSSQKITGFNYEIFCMQLENELTDV